MYNVRVAGIPKGGMADMRETIPPHGKDATHPNYSQKIVKPIF
jgi:hypothetical protein